MKHCLCILLVHLCCLPVLRAQESDTVGKRVPDFPCFRFTVQPLQLIVGEISANADWVYKRNSFGVIGAYRSRKLSENYAPDIESPSYLRNDLNAVSIGFSYKRVFSADRRWYYDVQAFYRHWWNYNDYSYPDGAGQTVTGRQTTDYNVYAIKALLGYKVVMARRGKIRPCLLVFAGVGTRIRTYTYEATSTTGGVPDPEYSFGYVRKLGSVHFGMQLGFEVFRKN
ncbi:hypothetical protein [Rurimicrobium arvi]|uniref:hypothetical protein n=1 Tax=Rurimicrobium arvi TaxID=2049916 RepID=UPI0031CF482D